MGKDFEEWLAEDPDKEVDQPPPEAPRPTSSESAQKPESEPGERKEDQDPSDVPGEDDEVEDDAVNVAEQIRRLSKVLTWPKLTDEGLEQYVEELLGLPVEHVRAACDKARSEREDGRLPPPAWFKRVAWESWDRERGIEQAKPSTDDEDPDAPKRDERVEPVAQKIGRHLGKTTKEVTEFLSLVGQVHALAGIPSPSHTGKVDARRPWADKVNQRVWLDVVANDDAAPENRRVAARALATAIRAKDIGQLRALVQELEEMKEQEERGLGIGDVG